MATQQSAQKEEPHPVNDRYEPAPRHSNKTVVIGGKLYVWAGLVRGLPVVHDSPEKRAVLSSVDVFCLESGDWVQQLTSGTPPLGVSGYACAAVGDELHYFGGYCGHGDCYHNGVHKLSTSSLQWVMLSPTASEDGAPIKKAYCGMVAFKDGAEDILFVVGGSGITPSSCQPGAQYDKDVFTDVCVRCNEQHMFTLSTGEWSSPNITGQLPPSCSHFTLTQVDERRAALLFVSSVLFSDLFLVELSRQTVHWTKIRKPTELSLMFSLVKWPAARVGHAAACVSGPLLVIMGGMMNWTTVISDCWIYDFTTTLWKKLPLPDSVTKRIYHSLSTLQLSPHTVWLIVFGGLRSLRADPISHTIIVELFQEGDGQWRVGRVMEGADLVRQYQQILSEWRRRGLLEENNSSDQLHQRVHQLEDEKRQLMAEKQEVTREKEQLKAEKEQQMTEKDQLRQELQTANTRADERLQQLRQQLMIEKAQLQQELQAANTRRDESQEQVQHLQQRLSIMMISEGREEQPNWVVRREEVEVTSEVVGRGAWGEVRVAKFRGLSVAAKCLYKVILSDYNLQQFTREMTIAAKLRHPNLLLFIGATREGEPIILTELMPTSLRRELERREMHRVQITSICQDVARALCYLHQWKPYPIIHCDISSGNVLLEPLPNGWRAKVSDYGSVNFMNLIVSTTTGPGNPFYAAPEANSPHLHSPKMDTYSFGVLLAEMNLRELPVSHSECQEDQIQRIQWPAMVSLIRSCTSERSADRPSMSDIMELLDRIQV